MYYSKSKLNHALDSETQKSELYLLRVWIFFIYDPFMDYPPRNAKPVHGSRNKDLIFKTTVAKKSERKTAKIPCSVASFLHEHEAARGNRVT